MKRKFVKVSILCLFLLGIASGIFYLNRANPSQADPAEKVSMEQALTVRP